MTRSNVDFLLRRAYEKSTACAAALALTTVLMLSVNASAATRPAVSGSVEILTPSVEILVPTVTIEVVPN
jgi:hypothetical protein